mgnify:CR=1 FL=1
MKTCPVCKITQMTSLTTTMCAWCSGKVGSDEAVCLGCGRTLLEVSRYGHPAGLPCFKLGWGSRPVSASGSGTIRTKVSCAICNDVFTDDITPGHVYICEGCRGAKTLEQFKAAFKQDAGRPLEVFVPPSIDDCVRVTKLESGDVLLFRLPRGVPAKYIEEFTAKLSTWKIRCLVIDNDMDVEVLRPSPAQETVNGDAQ